MLSAIIPLKNPVYCVKYLLASFKHVKSAYGFQIKAYLHKGMGGWSGPHTPKSKQQGRCEEFFRLC